MVQLPDIAVLSSYNPSVVDQRPAAVVMHIGLQADLPWPEEGAGLFHVCHKHVTILRHSQFSDAQSLLAFGALLLTTPVLCHQAKMFGSTGENDHLQFTQESDQHKYFKMLQSVIGTPTF